MSPRILRLLIYILVPLVLLIVSSSLIVEWLWMEEVGYSSIFWTLKAAQSSLSVLSFLVAGVYLVANLRFLADRLRSVSFAGTPLQQLNLNLARPEQHRILKWALTILALVLALVFALNSYLRWDESLRFIWNIPFGRVDPIFGRDIGFYLFQLPFWEFIQTSLTVLTFLTLASLALVYGFAGLIRVEVSEGVFALPGVLTHLRWNASAWLALLAWGFYLDRYKLLFDRGGIVFGAGYADIRVDLPALWILASLTLLLAVMMLAGRWVRLGKWITVTAVVALVALVLGLVVIPATVQQFNVEPNELELESPYLLHNVEMTRLAYGLDQVREVEYEADDTLTFADIRENQDAVDNIRLWDPRLLIQTYKQLQEIRSYYEFFTVDNDRYTVDGAVTQMMLSAREVAPSLPAQSNTWVNRHLQYTHGHGLVMSPVAETDRQGQPVLAIRDLPPRAVSPDLQVTEAAIYYGESGEGYYIVNTGTPELDYPSGDDNVYTRYTGMGGIAFKNWFRKLLFAWELGDMNIILSDYILPESRLQLWRGVQERIRKITPFLMLDRDPYLVLNQGRLMWIQDAYTISPNFPYAQPFGRFNYIRNAVKVVVDAYDGAVDYFVFDDSDPVLKVYRSIFPDLFKPLSDLPDGLESHFRYPQDLFEVQLELFNRYHMTGPQVFYNNEDLWARPNEKYGGQQLLMEPYYVLARLPETSDLEYMLISPLTPANRDNMIAWMVAKSDPDAEGQLLVYKLPKQRLIYGPAQIEARIDQDPEISRQIALWDQRGSRVIRGNLMVIPIENSFLYVEPVFLLAEGVDIPQLQRVIVAVGDDIAMQPTVEEAMLDLFGAEAATVADVPRALPGAPVVVDTVVVGSRELEEIRALWGRMRSALEAGNWAEYGRLLELMDERIGGE
jgi:hypothetical protein